VTPIIPIIQPAPNGNAAHDIGLGIGYLIGGTLIFCKLLYDKWGKK